MQRTPVFASGNGGYSFPNRLDQRLDVFERAVREYAVAEVEDVAGATGRAPEHASRPTDHALGGSEQDGWVQVALHAQVVADSRPTLIQFDTPVERDDFRAASCDQVEQPCGRGPEMDPRDVK